MSIGSAADIVSRVKQLIPGRWFKWAAPNRDAVLGGLADSAAWCYGLIGYARAQTRLATAYGIWLDILAYDFLSTFITRSGIDDNTFRRLIRATILQERVTRAGMVNAVTTLTGSAPWVFEPWNTYDTGAYSNSAIGQNYGSMGYGVGRGGYGNMKLPGQTFLKVTRAAPSGVPGVAGYGNNTEGYGAGAGEYVGSQIQLIGVTNTMIYRLINMTKPTGSICWVQIN